MSDKRYKLVFCGEVSEGKDVEKVKENLGSLFKLGASEVERLFSGKKVTIKKGLDSQRAARYKGAFEKAGAECVILPDQDLDGKIMPANEQEPEMEGREFEETVSDETPSRLPSSPMVCPKCGVEQEQAESCRRCGVIIEKYITMMAQQAYEPPPPEETAAEERGGMDTDASPGTRGIRVNMDFQGGVLSLFAMILLMGNPLLLPVAWGIAVFSSWVCENIELSEGYSVRFRGQGEEIWWAPVMMVVSPFLFGLLVSALIPGMIRSGGHLGVFKILFILILVVAAISVCLYYAYRILRWIIESVEFSWDGWFTFSGSYWGYMAWSFSMIIASVLVILLFSWLKMRFHHDILLGLILNITMAAISGVFFVYFLNWVFGRTTCSTDECLIWTGPIKEVAWRLFVLSMLPVIFALPVPHVHVIFGIVLVGLLIVSYAFVIHWCFKWFVQNIVIE